MKCSGPSTKGTAADLGHLCKIAKFINPAGLRLRCRPLHSSLPRGTIHENDDIFKLSYGLGNWPKMSNARTILKIYQLMLSRLRTRRRRRSAGRIHSMDRIVTLARSWWIATVQDRSSSMPLGRHIGRHCERHLRHRLQ